MRMKMALVFIMGALLSVGCRGEDVVPGVQDGGTKIDGTTNYEIGGPPVEATINKITSGEIGEASNVILKDVLVTAVDGYGQYTGDIYVQEVAGGSGSGIKLFRPSRGDGGQISDLKPGDHVKIDGTVKYYVPTSGFNDTQHPNKSHVKELINAVVTHLGPGSVPAPAEITVKELTEDPTADGWEGVLVKVKQVGVTSAVNPEYGSFDVTGGLEIDDDFYPHTPSVGDCLNITGISVYFYGYRLHPRDASDVETATGCAEVKSMTIFDLQDESSVNHPQPGTQVKVTGVITAVDGTKSGSSDAYYGFWIQDEAGGPYSGIYVYYSWTDATVANLKPVLGDLIDITGTYDEYYEVSELSKVGWVSKGPSTNQPTPQTVVAADIATGGSQAEMYEGVLVQVSNIKVGETTKDSKDKVLGFKDQASSLYIENSLYEFMAPTPPAQGTTYTSITGPLHYSFDNSKILPRNAGDMVAQ
ncbi:MAG: hypothetical protein V1754_15285 [Pseudomonadota bacterium]